MKFERHGLGEHILLFTGREWLSKEMRKLQQHAWQCIHSERKIIQVPCMLNSFQSLHFSLQWRVRGAGASRSGHKLTQEKNSTAWKFFTFFFLFVWIFFFSVCFFGYWLLLFLFFTAEHCLWARIFRDSHSNTKSFVIPFIQERISPLCPNQ